MPGGLVGSIFKGGGGSGSAGITASNVIFRSAPGEKWNYPSSNPAILEKVTLTNGTIQRHIFPDSTTKYLDAQINVPEDLTDLTNVNILFVGYPETASGGDIVLGLDYNFAGSGEDFDIAFTTLKADPFTTNASDKYYDYVTITATIASMGLSASDRGRITIYRDTADVADDLSGNWGLTDFIMWLT